MDNVTFKDRIDLLNCYFDPNGEEYDYLDIYLLKHCFDHGFQSIEEILELLEQVVVDKQEGLVLKMCNSFYEYKKSDKWCKVKKFDTLDLPVVGISPGEGKYEGQVGGLIVNYKGKKVTIGSGISNEDRVNFLTDTPKIIEVKYQAETKDKSLLFPTFVRVRWDKE